MQVLAVLSKSTKQGTSVFHFVETPDGQFWAFGGVAPKAMRFNSRKELDKCVMTWVNYGFSFGMVPTKKAHTLKVKRPQLDKQESQLPADLQMDLWALQPTCA